MAAFLGSIAKSYVAGKLGSSAIGRLTGGGEAGGGEGAAVGTNNPASLSQGIGQALGNLAAGSSGDTLSPQQFSMPAGGIQFFNRQKEQKKKRMF